MRPTPNEDNQMHTFGPTQATCHVFTFKEGLLSAVAHDLRLICRVFSIEASREAGISASFESASVVVDTVMREGQVHPNGLGTRDMDKIARSIRDEVLMAARHPKIGFTAPWPSDDEVKAGVGTVSGELHLNGVRRPVAVKLTRAESRWVARVSIHQPDFGMKPYSAMFGALKVKPGVVIELSLPAAELDA